MRAVGLFSGVGGIELGLSSAGISTELLCECWEPAVEILTRRFDAPVVGDVRELRMIPASDVITAGFPCTDLSQVGRMAGIGGEESGLVREVFRLVKRARPTWVLLENVTNMLSLHGGEPIRSITDWFDENDWNWAYRTVDSQYFGVPQRRRRVLMVASQSEDPRTILFADNHIPSPRDTARAHGFYWTEGNRGVGWGNDLVPTLKGGSKLGIPSPPAIWRKTSRSPGRAIVRPRIEVGEQLQGFEPGWTDETARLGHRWKMVGNAVTVPVAAWVGRRLVAPGEPVDLSSAFNPGYSWPPAASSVERVRQQWSVSEAPLNIPRVTISRLTGNSFDPLSMKATQGFYNRLINSRLRAGGQRFRTALEDHVRIMSTS